jgi:hypothetical protein
MIWITQFNINEDMLNENSDQKFNRGLDLFTESVLKPDPELRQCAHNQECFQELMYIRSYVIDYLKTLRRHQ